MSITISIQNLTKTFGHEVLFKDLNLSLHAEERIGLIGPNGSGKSTLLKILANQEDHDSGEIIKKSGLLLSHIHQTDDFDDSSSVWNAVYQKVCCLDESEKMVQAHQVLNMAGLEDSEQPFQNLSGGWRKRLSIALGLVTEPDMILLDEPTNHLDVEGIVWLETLLKKFKGSFILITHDRSFLNNTCKQILELNKRYPDGFFKVQGNYDQFLPKRSDFIETLQNKELVLSNKVSREEEWLSRGPKARTTKAKHRIKEAHELQKELKEIKSLNRKEQKMNLSLEHDESQTKQYIKIHKLCKAFDDKQIVENLSFVIYPGLKLGLIGPNGCGKSTLMKMIVGELNSDTGNVKPSPHITMSYFSQHRSELNLDDTLRHALQPSGADSVMFQGRSVHIITWAKRFLFTPDQLNSKVSVFSGGERARILLARLMTEEADVLLLDEPTNDLDIDSLEVLESALLEFKGAVIFSSHDRYFLNQVATKLLSFEENGQTSFYEDLTQWKKHQKKSEPTTQTVKKEKSNSKPQTKKTKKLTFTEQHELDHIEEKILKAEEIAQSLSDKTQDPKVTSDPEELTKVCEELEKAQTEVQDLYNRWEELEAKKS